MHDRSMRSTLASLVYNSFPVAAVAGKLRPRACILLYHRVGNSPIDPSRQAVSPERFEDHMRVLREKYQVEPLDALVEHRRRGGYRDRTVVVTFDDGYADNLHVAYPIAARAGVPMTVFVNVRPVVDGTLFWWDQLAAAVFAPSSAGRDQLLDLNGLDQLPAGNGAHPAETYSRLQAALKRMPCRDREEALRVIHAWAGSSQSDVDLGRPLTVPELVDLDRSPGVSVGAHTMTHPTLATLAPSEQLDEFRASKAWLEDRLGHPVSALAYPFGKPQDLSPETPRLAMEAGYRAAVTTSPRTTVPSSPPFALPRMTVHNWSKEEFAARLNRIFGDG